MLKVNDYGKILTLESLRKVTIDSLVRLAREEAKRLCLKSVDLGTDRIIDLTTSKITNGGLRYWFLCPDCHRRSGVLYQGPNGLTCRICVGYRYRSSRYKGMVS